MLFSRDFIQVCAWTRISHVPRPHTSYKNSGMMISCILKWIWSWIRSVFTSRLPDFACLNWWSWANHLNPPSDCDLAVMVRSWMNTVIGSIWMLLSSPAPWHNRGRAPLLPPSVGGEVVHKCIEISFQEILVSIKCLVQKSFLMGLYF